MVISFTFVLTIGWTEIRAAVGLIIGGVLAAPVGAYLVSRIPTRPLMIAVGIVIIASSAVRRSEAHTSELQSLMRTSYAVFCLKKKKISSHTHQPHIHINIKTNST